MNRIDCFHSATGRLARRRARGAGIYEPIGVTRHLSNDGWRFCTSLRDVVYGKLLVLRARQKQLALPYDTLAKLNVMET